MNSSAVYSLLYYAVFLLYPFLGLYVLSLNSREKTNQNFAILTVSLSVWALGYALSINAVDMEAALFWRRIASLGWGSTYALLLHFVLYLTGRGKNLDSKALTILHYAPALVSMLAFGPLLSSARSNYYIVSSASGWVSISLFTIWDIVFIVYYLIYSLVSLVVIIIWGAKSNDPGKKRTVISIGFAIMALVVLGTVIDIFETPNSPVPDLAIIFIPIPLITLIYSIRKHGIMRQQQESKTAAAGEILSDNKRKELFRYLSFAFFAGAILNLGHYFYFRVELNPVLLFGALLLLISVLFRLIPLLSISRKLQDDLMVALIAISVPLIMLHYLENYASNIVWPVPIIFMSLGAIYSRRRMIIAIFIAALLTQAYSWIAMPSITISVSHVDHLLRIILFILAAALALYINRTYVFRLRENDEQIRFQNLISHISTGLIRVDKSEIDKKFVEMLGLCGQYFQADRSYLFRIARSSRSMKCEHYWQNSAAAMSPDLTCDLVAEAIFHLAADHDSHEPLRVSSTDSLRETRSKIRKQLKELGTNSLMIIPLMSKNSIIGFWWLDTVGETRDWTDDHSKQLGVIANIFADTQAKVDAERVIYQMALYDELTGLPNKALFNSHMEKALSLAERSNEMIGIVFVDLDSFKQINDTMGHNFGDQILKLASERLSLGTRKYDTVSRFGGDEFLIMLPQMTSPEQIQQAANKIMSSFSEPIFVNEQEIFLTASAGISIYPYDGKDIEVLIKNADLAMYSAKERGKNRYAFYSDLMETNLQKNVHMTNQLHRALERGELVLYYQPQISIETGRIIGTEALLRWQHPGMGMIAPGVFIPLAESTGLINKIGLWVMRTACRQNKKWQQLGAADLRIAVNVSVEQLRSRDFVAKTAAVLHETGLDPKYLELEITESVFTRDPDQITEVLDSLKSLGLTISVDDFGTEYSSLSRLKEMPVDRLKIDMQFVQGLETNPKDRAITSIITSLSKNLNMGSTAEGVETIEQLDHLRELDCDEAQGYYFYKPLPAQEAENTILADLSEDYLSADI